MADVMSNTVKTFQQAFCEIHGCPSERFRQRVFWRTLPVHARLIAPLILLLSREHFHDDHRLIGDCAFARSVRQVRADVEGHFHGASGWGLLRRRGRVRISTAKLIALAKDCLPEKEENYPMAARR